MDSEDSDEPLASIAKFKKENDNEWQPKAPKKKKKKKEKSKKKKGIKIVLKMPKEQLPLPTIPQQVSIERPVDVWLYMKDLNPCGPYSCLLCSEWFINRSRLVLHYVLNHKKDYCGICRYFVDNREAWAKHVDFHSPWICARCTQSCDTEDELKVHYSESHQLVHCRICHFMMPDNEDYTTHLKKKHLVTHPETKNLPVFWLTEYDGCPKFQCQLCTNADVPTIDFFKHYMCYHKFTLKCFSALLSGNDISFSVTGVNISVQFLENELKGQMRYGYVDREQPPIEEQRNIGNDSCDSNMQLFQALIPEIKQETSDNESETAPKETPKLQPTPNGCEDLTKSDFDLSNYVGHEDYDMTMTEIVVLDKCLKEYLDDVKSNMDSNMIPANSKIAYTANDEEPNKDTKDTSDIICQICQDAYQSLSQLVTHMTRMHLLKCISKYNCRMCATTFENESELSGHQMQELKEFDDLWLCQFCDLEFECREVARKHLSEHWHELNKDNCCSPHLGFKCRYCSCLFWNERDREEHHYGEHFTKHSEHFYKCNMCDKYFSDKVFFVHHYTSSHTIEENILYVMKCFICSCVCTNIDTMREHFKESHPEARKIYCSFGSCKYKPFSHTKSFKTHIKSFHSPSAIKNEGNLSCMVCAREFTSARACGSHMSLAHGPGRFKCKLCPMTLQSMDERKLHYMIRHPGEHPFTCTDCGKSFQYKSTLYLHKRVHITEETVFTCHYCQKTFTKKDSYKEHLLIHEGPRHSCSYCPAQFVQRSNMLRHERRHTGERPYNCLHCGRAFADKGACNSHMRTHTGKETFKCMFCPQTFVQKSKLKYHMRKHTGEDLEQCEQCSKYFTSPYALREHQKTHEMQKTECPLCHKPFNSPRYMIRHIKTYHHTMPAVLKCPLCPASFSTRAAHRNHVLTHAKVKPFKCKICNRRAGCKKTLQRHIRKKHNKDSDDVKYYIDEIEPHNLNINLNRETIDSIFGPQKSADYMTGFMGFPHELMNQQMEVGDELQQSEGENHDESDNQSEGSGSEPAKHQEPIKKLRIANLKRAMECSGNDDGDKSRMPYIKKEKCESPVHEIIPEPDFVTIKIEPYDEDEQH